MKKIYRNQIPEKPKPKTKAQRRREWEYTVIGGGMVRASAFARTANILNRGRGAVVCVVAVPLVDARQLPMLEEIADEGILGQTAGEVAAWFIRDGLLERLNRKCHCCGQRVRS